MNFYPRHRPNAEKLLLMQASRTVLIQCQHPAGQYAIVAVTQRIVCVHFLRSATNEAAHSQYFQLPNGLHDGRGWNLIELTCFVEEL